MHKPDNPIQHIEPILNTAQYWVGLLLLGILLVLWLYVRSIDGQE